ncbi:MAG: MarR family winged helix-turn-helix transcriptional regulator, partial [Micrococcaceae bacterium]
TTARLMTRLESTLKSELDLHLGDYNLMLLLTESKTGCMRMGELAEAMVFSPSRLTYQVKILENRGLVRRERSDSDARSWVASLTKEGRQTFRKAAVLHVRDIETYFTGTISDDEAMTIDTVFSRIQDQLLAE